MPDCRVERKDGGQLPGPLLSGGVRERDLLRLIGPVTCQLMDDRSLQAAQHWALAHMPLRGEIWDVLSPMLRQCNGPKGRDAITACHAKLNEKGLTRYILPTQLSFVARQLKVR